MNVFIYDLHFCWRESSSIVTRLRTGRPRNRVIFSTGARDHLLHNAQTGYVPPPVSYPMDMGGMSPELKWPKRETNRHLVSRLRMREATTLLAGRQTPGGQHIWLSLRDPDTRVSVSLWERACESCRLSSRETAICFRCCIPR
jgi:hypothetical protein